MKCGRIIKNNSIPQKMIRFKFLSIIFIMAMLYSCDDSTPNLGNTTIPDSDHILSDTASYEVTTKSLLMDSVYARTRTACLGRYTDPVFGEFTADFMAQFTCTDNFEFPETLQEVKGVDLFVQYLGFYGDSLAAMKMEIDTLSKVIPEESKTNFYTSINPADFYNKNAAPIKSVTYSAGGESVDTIFTSSGSKIYNQTIKLPLDFGQYMYNKYKEDKNNYKDAAQFIKNVLKGFYMHCSSGDGSVLYIDNLVLQLNFDYLIKSSSGKVDSLVTGITRFAATKEVIQVNHFQNSSKLQDLANDGNATYIKTPAGIVTEATIPIDEIESAHSKDTLNSASITFTKYYSDDLDAKYPMGTPQYLLMLRKSELYSFFENNKLPDSKTSFVTTIGSTTATHNQYTYSNIARLITHCINEKNKGLKNNPNWLNENPDWNKVVLVPVNVEYDSNSTSPSVIKVSNSLEIQSVKLVGGKDKIKMKIIYTNY